jgi:phosphoethanolamine N-methyltransferase
MFLSEHGEVIDDQERKELLTHLPDLRAKRVLELGSGIGRYTGEFAKRATEVVTVDFIEHFVEKNRRKNQRFANVQFLCKDVMDLDFHEGEFDLIFINWLFMYLEDEEVKQLRWRLCSWLRRGGHLFFRESCSLTQKEPASHDPATYRTLDFYTDLFAQPLHFVKEESVNVSINTFANPLQCFWLFKKPMD